MGVISIEFTLRGHVLVTLVIFWNGMLRKDVSLVKSLVCLIVVGRRVFHLAVNGSFTLVFHPTVIKLFFFISIEFRRMISLNLRHQSREARCSVGLQKPGPENLGNFTV